MSEAPRAQHLLAIRAGSKLPRFSWLARIGGSTSGRSKKERPKALCRGALSRSVNDSLCEGSAGAGHGSDPRGMRISGTLSPWALTAICLFTLAIPVPSVAQDVVSGGTYVGAGVCGSCHAEQFEMQSRTGHARTLQRASDHPLADHFVPEQTLGRSSGYRFKFRREGQQIIVQADDNEYISELPIDWAFGAGDHGVTFVSRLNRQYYLEHAFSYYSAAGTLGITTGHETIRPESLLQAMGVRYVVRGPGNAISDCFACHSTGPLSYSARQEVQVNEAGVRCESCHGPGGGHVEAISINDSDLAHSRIQNPKRLAADELLHYCGSCHRDPRRAEGEFDFELAWNVRHQPPYLRQSRCFQRSGETLTCFTCHDPHEPVRRGQPEYYRERCMECHQGAGRGVGEDCEADRPSDCTKCHMPTVAVNQNLKLKNHWIGVYAGDSRLKPER